MIADPTAEPVAVRIETAAHLLDATPAQVRFWIKEGILPAYKLGRVYRIARADLDKLGQKAVTVR